MNFDTVKTYGRLGLRLLGLAAVVGGVLVLGLLGWQWQSSVTVDHVAVTGTRHAPADTVRHLARVDSGAVMSDLEEALVADRVTRHPWVKRADVTKQRARRTLLIEVTERTPAALVLDGDGRATYYLDRNGYAMPRPDSTGYDVPLVRGLEAEYHPVQQVAPPLLRNAMTALSRSEAAPLIAELSLQPDSSIGLVTVPLENHGALSVQLGRGEFVPRLRRLRAFAEQVLTARSGAAVEQIDLRFDGQIVTREHPLDG